MTAAEAGNSAGAPVEAGNYPKEAVLKRDVRVSLRLMDKSDAGLLHGFFCGIPREDLLFLRRDVTSRPVIDQWAERVDHGSVVTVLALQAERLVGEASLHLSSISWSDHVGEIRVVTDRSMRQSGLGSRLTSEIFLVALARGIQKIVAEMTIEQKNAIAVFQKLGFRVEGLLRNHVRDQQGVAHDLVLMGHETQEFYDQMRAYGFEETLND